MNEYIYLPLQSFINKSLTTQFTTTVAYHMFYHTVHTYILQELHHMVDVWSIYASLNFVQYL